MSCWFPHTNEEMEVWQADRNGRFNGKEIVAGLRYKLNQEISGNTGSRQPPGAYPYNQKGAQAPGAFPHATLQVNQNGFQQPPAVIRTAPPMSPSSVPTAVSRTSAAFTK